jgi:hypothetical protein
MSEYTLIHSILKPKNGPEPTYRVLKPCWGGSGIFSYVWGCMQSIFTYPNDKYYFDMREFSPYYDPSITHTNNTWEYYFQQPYTKEYPDNNDIIATGIWNDHPSGFCHLTNISPEKRLVYHNIIKKNVILQPYIKEKIDKFAIQHDMANKKILGVHCRGDKAIFDCAHPNPPEHYINEIKEVEKDYDLIFIISDQDSYIEEIKNKFGNKVLSYEEAIHQTIFNREEMITNVAHGSKLKDKYKSGEGVVIDSYLLSYSKFIICPYSNVSTFSHYLNLDTQYMDIDIKYGHVKMY